MQKLSSEEQDRFDQSRVLYKICVVGAGMVGSSAAKYATKIISEGQLKETSAHKVCLIGPDEPKSREESEILAAHYDEARICRKTAADPRWATVTSRAIQRFRDIEAESGIKFYEEVGCLMAANPKDSNYVSLVHEAACKLEIKSAKLLNSQQLAEHFPYLKLSEDHIGLWEFSDAGYINPRRLVQAQKILAERYGCDLVKDIVHSIRPALDVELKEAGVLPANSKVLRIQTDGGKIIYSEKILLATNAFTEGFRELLPPGVSLDMSAATQAVVLVEFTQDDLEKLKSMPSMLIQLPDSAARESTLHDSSFTAVRERILQENSFAEAYSCYILPPVQYPDGKVYMKLGHGGQMHKSLTPTELVRWYREPVPENFVESLKEMIRSLFPDITPVSMHTDTCATVDTVTDLPYISFVRPSGDVTDWSSLAVSVGDCGCSAKCCDELGRLAAQLLISGWNDESLNEKDFIARFKQ